MVYASSIPGEGEKMNWMAIHESAAQHARREYHFKFGLDYHRDPEYKTGNDRHAFWLMKFEERYESLILNPHQA